MGKPRILDLFCCAGGAGTGYARAGFDVVGVDIDPQPNYPFPFYKGDALAFLQFHIDHPDAVSFFYGPDGVEALKMSDFDAIHASPPCQAYSTITPDKSKHLELIEPTRALLANIGKPYVIENVAGAKPHLLDPMMLCGSSFGLRVRRHRFFESNVWLSSLPCNHAAQGTAVGVYGDHPEPREYFRPDGSRRGAKATSVPDASDAMGIDWMTWLELAEAIPPAFTEFIGQQLLTAIGEEAA